MRYWSHRDTAAVTPVVSADSPSNLRSCDIREIQIFEDEVRTSTGKVAKGTLVAFWADAHYITRFLRRDHSFRHIELPSCRIIGYLSKTNPIPPIEVWIESCRIGHILWVNQVVTSTCELKRTFAAFIALFSPTVEAGYSPGRSQMTVAPFSDAAVISSRSASLFFIFMCIPVWYCYSADSVGLPFIRLGIICFVFIDFIFIDFSLICFIFICNLLFDFKDWCSGFW